MQFNLSIELQCTTRIFRYEVRELTDGCLRDEQLIVLEPGDYLHELFHKTRHAADEDGIIAFHDKFVMYLQLVGLLGNCERGEQGEGG